MGTTESEAAAPDPNQKAVGDFVDALMGFSKIIRRGAKKQAASADARSTGDERSGAR